MAAPNIVRFPPALPPTGRTGVKFDTEPPLKKKAAITITIIGINFATVNIFVIIPPAFAPIKFIANRNTINETAIIF
jgi:hypothetical protein